MRLPWRMNFETTAVRQQVGVSVLHDGVIVNTEATPNMIRTVCQHETEAIRGSRGFSWNNNP